MKNGNVGTNIGYIASNIFGQFIYVIYTRTQKSGRCDSGYFGYYFGLELSILKEVKDMVEEHYHHEGSNTGLVIAVLAVLVVVLFLIFGTNMFGTGTANQPIPQPNGAQQETQSGGGEGGSINVDVPDQIDVNVPKDAGNGTN